MTDGKRWWGVGNRGTMEESLRFSSPTFRMTMGRRKCGPFSTAGGKCGRCSSLIRGPRQGCGLASSGLRTSGTLGFSNDSLTKLSSAVNQVSQVCAPLEGIRSTKTPSVIRLLPTLLLDQGEKGLVGLCPTSRLLLAMLVLLPRMRLIYSGGQRESRGSPAGRYY